MQRKCSRKTSPQSLSAAAQSTKVTKDGKLQAAEYLKAQGDAVLHKAGVR